VFFPPTFYSSVTNEISSRGYENLLIFYSYMQTLKRKFFKFYMDKRYFSNYSKVEPFVKESENIFYGQSLLPANLAPGFSVNMLYIVILFWFSYSGFRKSLFSLPLNENSESPRDLELKKGELAVFVSEGELFKNLLFNLWNGETLELGKKGYEINVHISDHSPANETEGEAFFYFCHPDSIPGDITTNDFLSFMGRLANSPGSTTGAVKHTAVLKEMGLLAGKRFSRLKIHEKGEVMLAVLRMQKKDVYLLYDTARGMPIEFTVQLKEQMEALKEQGSLVVYLTHDELINVTSIKKGFHRSSTWGQLVDHYKELLEI
jgi:ABC-type transport system involved in cytochrome c biogenesis ATPase subunit